MKPAVLLVGEALILPVRKFSLSHITFVYPGIHHLPASSVSVTATTI